MKCFCFNSFLTSSQPRGVTSGQQNGWSSAGLLLSNTENLQFLCSVCLVFTTLMNAKDNFWGFPLLLCTRMRETNQVQNKRHVYLLLCRDGSPETLSFLINFNLTAWDWWDFKDVPPLHTRGYKVVLCGFSHRSSLFPHRAPGWPVWF